MCHGQDGSPDLTTNIVTTEVLTALQNCSDVLMMRLLWMFFMVRTEVLTALPIFRVREIGKGFRLMQHGQDGSPEHTTNF